jgi:AmiR/NasT family two-component response regulator
VAPSTSDSAPSGGDSSDKSLTAAEAEIEETRERLAQTIDMLLERTSPKNVVRREVAGVKAFFVDPQGNPRTENILKVAVGVVGFVGVVVVIRSVAR